MSARPDDPADLLALVRRLEAKVRDLEQSQSARTSLTFRDPAGTKRVVVGWLPSGQYGVVVYNAAGVATFTQSNV